MAPPQLSRKPVAAVEIFERLSQVGQGYGQHRTNEQPVIHVEVSDLGEAALQVPTVGVAPGSVAAHGLSEEAGVARAQIAKRPGTHDCGRIRVPEVAGLGGREHALPRLAARHVAQVTLCEAAERPQTLRRSQQFQPSHGRHGQRLFQGIRPRAGRCRICRQALGAVAGQVKIAQVQQPASTVVNLLGQGGRGLQVEVFNRCRGQPGGIMNLGREGGRHVRIRDWRLFRALPAQGALPDRQGVQQFRRRLCRSVQCVFGVAVHGCTIIVREPAGRAWCARLRSAYNRSDAL